MFDKLAGAAKALLAALISFLGAVSTALIDDKSLAELTDGQWVTAILAGLVALGAVYGVPNRSE
jgi:hypothetical protein